MANNRLSIRPCTPDDLPALSTLHLAAFAGPRHGVMYGNVTLEDTLRFLEDGLRRQLADHTAGPHPQHVHSLCVVDGDTDAIVSHVVWIGLPKGYLASEDLDTQRPWLPPGMNEALVRDLYRKTGELRSAHTGPGEPHWLLSLLATHPEHQGLGAGSMLIEWAFPRADELGLRCYVDASAKGYSLYKKRGFSEQVGVLEVDMGKYEGGGGHEIQRWVALARGPKVAVSHVEGKPSAHERNTALLFER